ncbi:DNA-methyltransferase [Weissella kandleri]|uniref:DNA-methyltransferase n=1 Tax=Weissella kandleri TaxID=1616 RepID=UPI00387ED240
MKLINGETLEEMAKLPDESIDLVLVDPPYGTIKGVDKTTDMKNVDWDVLVDMDEMFNQYKRLLKVGGRLIMFGNNGFTQQTRDQSTSVLNYAYPMYWIKNSFGNPLQAKRAPLSYIEDISVFNKNDDRNSVQAPMTRKYSRDVRTYLGNMKKSEIMKPFGNFKLSHFLSSDGVQFGIPSKEAYESFVRYYDLDKWEMLLSYQDLKMIFDNEKTNAHNKIARRFNMVDGAKHIPNKLAFDKPTHSVHPTQKPTELLEYLIKVFSNEGDVVLDNTMGSGSTGVACVNTNRDFIGIELDKHFFDIAVDRIETSNKC